MERFSRDDSFLSTTSPGDGNRGERPDINDTASRAGVVSSVESREIEIRERGDRSNLTGWPVGDASTNFSREQSLPSFDNFSIPKLELPLVKSLVQDLNFDFVVVDEPLPEGEREEGQSASEDKGGEFDGRSATKVVTPSNPSSPSAERDVLEDRSFTPSTPVSNESALEERATSSEETSFEEESGSTETPAEELNQVEETEAVENTTNETVANLQSIAGTELFPDEVKATAVFSDKNAVNALDFDRIYQFSVAESGVFTAQLNELTGDADVQLIEDRNRNGVVDQGEIIAWQWERGTAGESIRKFINEGDYLLRVQSHQDASADYQLSTGFTPSATDELSFSIELELRGLDALSEQARAGLYRAAEYWENIITHSSLDRSQVVNVKVFGTSPDTDERYLAFGGPRSFLGDTNDRLITSKGVVMINQYYAESRYNKYPSDLEEIMRHELGHVLGLGTSWKPRNVLVGGEALVVNDFIDFDNQTYRADTYAGQAYGELLGQSEAAIPLSTDKAHWSESALDRELMTPRAEGVGSRLPLSQITIAALRDLGWNVNYGAAEVSTLAALVAPSGGTFA